MLSWIEVGRSVSVVFFLTSWEIMTKRADRASDDWADRDIPRRARSVAFYGGSDSGDKEVIVV
jgi:hypothetical protein